MYRSSSSQRCRRRIAERRKRILNCGTFQSEIETLIAWIVGLLLAVPITIVNMLESFAHRLVVIEIFSALLIIALSIFTKAKVAQLSVCGAK